MDLAGSHFFTSATFWGPAIGAIVGVLTTAVVVWVTLRAANPKRRLLYSMPVVTPLLNTRPDLPQDIEVRRAGSVLAHPYVVNVELTSRGRRDIAREAFGGDPIRLDVGAPIIDCLKISTSPSDRPHPVWNVDGSKLLVGPSLIGRRQSTVFSLLVDGPSPRLSKPMQTLTEVRLLPWDSASGAVGVPAGAVILVAGLTIFVGGIASERGVLWGVLAGFVVVAVATVVAIAFARRGKRARWPDE